MPDNVPRTAPWWLIPGYFVVFFAAMTLGGVLFLLGGITIILIPGSLPIWAEVGYVLLGIAGSIAIAVAAANGAFRQVLRRRELTDAVTAPAARPKVLAWLAGIAGAVLASALSVVATTVVTRLMGH